MTELNPPRIWKFVDGAGKLTPLTHMCNSIIGSGLCVYPGLFEVVSVVFLRILRRAHTICNMCKDIVSGL